jgi:hypothetical protein
LADVVGVTDFAGANYGAEFIIFVHVLFILIIYPSDYRLRRAKQAKKG